MQMVRLRLKAILVVIYNDTHTLVATLIDFITKPSQKFIYQDMYL